MAQPVSEWYTRGVFNHFEFDEETRITKLKNMVGIFKLCKRHVKGRYQCTTNFGRHMKVTSYK